MSVKGILRPISTRGERNLPMTQLPLPLYPHLQFSTSGCGKVKYLRETLFPPKSWPKMRKRPTAKDVVTSLKVPCSPTKEDRFEEGSKYDFITGCSALTEVPRPNSHTRRFCSVDWRIAGHRCRLWMFHRHMARITSHEKHSFQSLPGSSHPRSEGGRQSTPHDPGGRWFHLSETHIDLAWKQAAT